MDNLLFSKFVNLNEKSIISCLEDMNEHGHFYRTFRVLLTVLQILPPINFLSSKQDIIFSDLINQKLFGTTLDVYTIKTYRWNNIWTCPVGAPLHSIPILQSIPLYGIIKWLAIYNEQKSNSEKIQRGISKLENGQIKIDGLPNVVMYRSERMTEILNLDEQFAISFFELGKNCLLFDYLLNKKINKICMFLSAILGIGGSALIPIDIKLNDGADFEMIIAVIFIIISVILIFMLYQNRKYIWNVDNIVKNCGYAKEMASALRKMDSYHSGRSFILSGANIPEQVINIVDTVLYQLQKLASLLKINFTPYIGSRIKNLEKENDYHELNISEKELLNANFGTNNIVNIFESVIDKCDITMEKIVKNYLVPTL